MAGTSEQKANKSDWVTKRAACTLANVFRTLRVQVEEDVRARNALRPENSPYEFLVTEKDEEFAALLKAQNIHKTVNFVLNKDAILVQDDKRIKMFVITLTFDDSGDCKLSADGAARELWQIARMALEELFF
jgi:hypothetical protein